MVDASVETVRSRRAWPPRSWIVPVLGAAGLALLAWLIVDLGPSRIAAELRRLGPVLPAVLLITAAKYPIQAAGWRLLLPRNGHPSWGASIAATIAGDALGYRLSTAWPVSAGTSRRDCPISWNSPAKTQFIPRSRPRSLAIWR